MKANQDNFDRLVGQGNSGLRQKLEWAQANKGWLRKSAYIAVKTLVALKEKGLSQKELAYRIGVTPQYVSKLVKGKENLSLETIDKLEQALGIVLLPMEREVAKTEVESGLYESAVPVYILSKTVVTGYTVRFQTPIASEDGVKYGKSA